MASANDPYFSGNLDFRTEVKLDDLPFSEEEKHYLRGDDLVRFRSCAKEIYNRNPFDATPSCYYSIVRYCVQEGDLGKIDVLTDLVRCVDKAWMCWIVMYWAWELQKYEIFAYSWIRYLYDPSRKDFLEEDDIYPKILITRNHWPEELVPVLEVAVIKDNILYIGLDEDNDVDNWDAWEKRQNERTERLIDAICSTFPEIARLVAPSRK